VEIINLSAEPMGKLYSWLPHNLKAERVVFLPDACPGKSPLPTGTAVLTSQKDWRRLAVSDCGCGMRLIRSRVAPSDLTIDKWEALGLRIRQNKGQLGDLGGGNHFLDALEPYDGGPLHVLIHTGSRNESGLVDDLVDQPDRFDLEFARIVQWAEENRRALQDSVEEIFGEVELVLDLPHNTYEQLEGGRTIIRKGSIKVLPGDLMVLPSHMTGDVLLAKAKGTVDTILNSMSHGTGRAMSRSDCKIASKDFDYVALREQIMIPSYIDDASLRSEGPFAYRELDECLALIGGYIEEVERFSVVAYLGHL
jgi:hypothetical protein